MKPLVLPSYESLPCQSIMGDWEFDCKSADADSFFYKRRSLTVPCCVLCARLDDTVSRVSRSLLWTTVDCQQRFLAGGLLQQYLWGQLIHPRPPYGSNSPLSPSLLSLRPVQLDTEWMVTGAVSVWRATNRRSPETISSWGLCVWCV